MTTRLFDPITMRGVTMRNRLWVSPMCMYSSENGLANDFHLAHWGQYALGGAGMIVIEATGVMPEGRITSKCMGIWSDEHAQAMAPAVRFAQQQGAMVAIQLAHAGRKASANPPGQGPGFQAVDDGGWVPIGPSDDAFPTLATPRTATNTDLEQVIAAFAAAAVRSVDAGFDAIEIHGAHGYLLHQFCSPLVNSREDEWGGSFTNRTRLAIEVARAIRAAIADCVPLLYRVSATDWVDGGWTVQESIELARLLKAEGVDMIDVSSGGAVANAQIPVGPGYQVPLSAQIREGAQICTCAVGLITDAHQAAQVLADNDADAVMVARGWLRDSQLGLHWADELGEQIEWPRQYQRGRLV